MLTAGSVLVKSGLTQCSVLTSENEQPTPENHDLPVINVQLLAGNRQSVVDRV